MRWKNADRDDHKDDKTQEQLGQVLNMTLFGDDVWTSIYTVPILIGPPSSQTSYPVQVDTGSADLWIAAQGCSGSGCSSVPQSSLFVSSSTTVPTGSSFSISYVSGQVSGNVVWDTLQIGMYSMSSQAFAAASTVQNEDLSAQFVGVLGMALSADSIIAQALPPTIDGNGDVPDGATFSNNLFGITPVQDAPSNQFFGFLLERPGMPQDESFVSSQFAIGMHPPIPAPLLQPLTQSNPNANFTSLLVNYTTNVIPSSAGYLHWRSQLTLLTVYTPEEKNVVLPGGRNSLYPTVIFDTGGSTILTTSAIAQAIWQSVGISRAVDGNYYIPCTTPLNMTITFASLPPIPVHPLDLSGQAPSTASADPQSCLGSIQASSSLDADTAPADIVLGVPFLRNVYIVLTPNPLSSSPSNSSSSALQNAIPTISLLPLTNITLALAQFHTVRVLNTPLTSPSSPSSSIPSNGGTSTRVGHKLSLGIIVLLAVLALALAVGGLFAGWWYVQRRNLRNGKGRFAVAPGERDEYGKGDTKTVIGLGAELGSLGTKSERTYSVTDSSVRTLPVAGMDVNEAGEEGRMVLKDVNGKSRARGGSRSMSGYFREPEPWEVAGGGASGSDSETEPGTIHSRPPSAREGEGHEEFPFSIHTRTPSELGEIREGYGGLPLLAPEMGRRGSLTPDDTLVAFPSSKSSVLRSGRSGSQQSFRDDRYPFPLPNSTQHRGSITDSPTKPTLPIHLRANSDERYPILAPGRSLQSHNRDRSASSGAGTGANGNLIGLDPPPKDRFANLRLLTDPFPTLQTPLDPIPDSDTHGSTTPTASMAGVGSARRQQDVDTDLLAFTENLNAAVSKPFTYPPSIQTQSPTSVFNPSLSSIKDRVASATSPGDPSLPHTFNSNPILSLLNTSSPQDRPRPRNPRTSINSQRSNS